MKTSPRKPVTDINFEKERDRKPHEYKNAKQSQLSSAFDVPRDVPQRKAAEEGPQSSPVKGRNPTQHAKLSNLTSNISGMGTDPNTFYHKP